MTECERLIHEGFIDEEFLNEETRCDYKITSDMKKVWAIQLKILHDFHQICKEHGLHYCVSGGTMIGAIRHGGYIPWDDDIDVTMPRNDYKKLIEHPEWFISPNELHLASNQEGYYEGWARVHNTRTAVLYDNYQVEGSKQGIYIDIFPLDGYDSKLFEKINFYRIWLTNIIGHAFCYNVNNNPLLKQLVPILRKLRLFNCEKAFKKVNKLAVSQNTNPKYVMSKMAKVYGIERQSFPSDDYASEIEVKFENITVCVPIGYDNVLKRTYGDYMSFPPIERRGSWHSFQFDTEKSFKCYQRK